MLEPTCHAVPPSPAAKEDAGVPFGVVIQPLAPLAPPRATPRDALASANALGACAEEVARCKRCYGYISAACAFYHREWRCALCGAHNALPRRYASKQLRARLPELAGDSIVEMAFGGDESGGVEARRVSEGGPQELALQEGGPREGAPPEGGLTEGV